MRKYEKKIKPMSERSSTLDADVEKNRRFVLAVKRKCSREKIIRCVKGLVPISKWLPQYRWKDFAIGDLQSGILLSVLHVPQGLSYAMLANVEPVIGIRTGVIPVLVYIVFGTSRHISLGTFAVVCLMTGDIVSRFSGTVYSAEDVAVSVTFIVGLLQLAWWILRLGVFCRLLSETVISAVTTGAAVHVLTSQVRVLLAVKLTQYVGSLSLVWTYRELFSKILTCNVSSIVAGLTAIAFQVSYNVLLFPRIKKYRISSFIPIELLVLVLTMIVAWSVDLPSMPVMGDVPSGFARPGSPIAGGELLWNVLGHSVAVAVVAFTVSYSLAVVLADIEHPVDANQELLAHGLSNLVGSVFGCVPAAASLSRSVMQRSSGGRTQMAGLVSSAILICVLFGAGPLFRPVPKAILAALVIVSISALFKKACITLPETFRMNRIDAVVWVITFLMVVLMGTLWGLVAGVCLDVLHVFQQSATVNVSLIGRLEHTQIGFVSISSHPDAVEIPGIKIFRLYCNLNYCNVLYVRERVEEMSGVNITAVSEIVASLKKTKHPDEVERLEGLRNEHLTVSWKSSATREESQRLRCIVLDLSKVEIWDLPSVNIIRNMKKTFSDIDIMFIPISEILTSLEPVGKIEDAIKIAEEEQGD